MVFGDGKPITAYEDTFRRWPAPDIGFDFEWYYRPIKNWGTVVDRKIPLDLLGVEALDPHTIAFTTTRTAAEVAGGSSRSRRSLDQLPFRITLKVVP